ncbi:Top3a [Symbiodinium natans]|uniref:Top3a protein n=1 Tax=Symbiodinium natans TaxID=878477 RepID=A0A812L0D9_9DINO|nr:Top3a [Symbiodinium natans]
MVEGSSFELVLQLKILKMLKANLLRNGPKLGRRFSLLFSLDAGLLTFNFAALLQLATSDENSGEKAARLREKANGAKKKRASTGADPKEIMARAAGEEDVRALQEKRGRKRAAPEPEASQDLDSDEDEDADAPPCHCGMPAERKTVKWGANAGKEYYRCCIFPEAEHCDFFVWAGAAGAPRCRCEPPQAAIQLEVKKEGPNQGKRFFKCPKPRDHQCSYFEWLDKVPGQASSAMAQGRLCMCGQTAIKFQVQKEGPNKGRFFLKCPAGACLRFFEWLDEVAKESEPFLDSPRQRTAGAERMSLSKMSFVRTLSITFGMAPCCSCEEQGGNTLHVVQLSSEVIIPPAQQLSATDTFVAGHARGRIGAAKMEFQGPCFQVFVGSQAGEHDS